MLTKQARLWYNETLYWENGANAPFSICCYDTSFPPKLQVEQCENKQLAHACQIGGEPFPEEKHGENAKRKA